MEGLIKMCEELMEYINEEMECTIVSAYIRGWCNSIEILLSPNDFEKFKNLGEYIEEPKVVDNRCIKYMSVRVNDCVTLKSNTEVTI